MNSKNKILMGIMLVLISTIIWGGMFPIMTVVLKEIDPFYFTLFRYGLVAIIFSIILFCVEGKEAFNFEGKGIKLWILGTFGFAGFSFLVFLGQMIAGPPGGIIASIMMAVQPLLGSLILLVYKGVKATRLAIISMVVSLIGVVLVVTNGDLSLLFSSDKLLLALILIIVGDLSWVIYTTCSDDFKHWSIIRFSTISMILGVVSIIIIVFTATIFGLLKIPSMGTINDILPELLYMVIPAGVISVLSWNLGNRIVTPINGILFMNVVPVTSFTINIILGYKIGIVQIIGAIIVIVSLVVNNLYSRNK